MHLNLHGWQIKYLVATPWAETSWLLKILYDLFALGWFSSFWGSLHRGTPPRTPVLITNIDSFSSPPCSPTCIRLSQIPFVFHRPIPGSSHRHQRDVAGEQGTHLPPATAPSLGTRFHSWCWVIWLERTLFSGCDCNPCSFSWTSSSFIRLLYFSSSRNDNVPLRLFKGVANLWGAVAPLRRSWGLSWEDQRIGGLGFLETGFKPRQMGSSSEVRVPAAALLTCLHLLLHTWRLTILGAVEVPVGVSLVFPPTEMPQQPWLTSSRSWIYIKSSALYGE